MNLRLYQYLFLERIRNNIIKFSQKLGFGRSYFIFQTKIADNIQYKNIFYKINKFYNEIEIGNGCKIPLFSSVEIETINKCNLTCSFCPTNKNNDPRPFKLMDETLFKKIILELKELNYNGKIRLYSSNEPFLDKRIIDFLKFAKINLPNAEHALFTNGTVLTLEKFLASVDYLDRLIINNYNDNSKLIPTVKIIKEYIDNNPQYQSKVIIRLRLVNQQLTSRGGNSKNVKPLKLKSSCYKPFEQIIIRPNGDLSLCCHDALNKSVMGNITENKLINIWNNEKYKKIRSKLKQKKYARKNIVICSKCDA
ncbi:MAG: SPASM domain-containing protein [Methanobrevibacter sp.]|jgi:radical SAM protein with 4Fe4S-binding SPASM domain|nr:SPASM domain-containing protein [Candidatus Methanoflexus mossambicus]